MGDTGNVETVVANSSGDAGDSGSVPDPTGRARIIIVITPIV